MAKCPHCDNPVSLNSCGSDGKNEVRRETRGTIKKEILYSCPHCGKVIGFGSFIGGLFTGRP